MLIHRGRVFRLVQERVPLPGGGAARLDIVRHPGAVAIVPMISRTDVLLIRQYRGSVRRWLYEIPAGTLERGESPRRTAARELVEETGHRPARLSLLARFYTAPGFCTELMHLYLARDLRPAEAARDPDERIRVVRVPLARAVRWAREGRVRDAKSIVGLLLAASA